MKEAAELNKKLAGFLHGGDLTAAEALFERLTSIADIVSWNTILSARQRAGDFSGALLLFLRLRRAGLRPTPRTLSTAAASSSRACPAVLPQLHAAAVRAAASPAGPFLGTAFLAGYSKAGNLPAARQMFEEMPCKSPASWNILISAMLAARLSDEARLLFSAMPARPSSSWTALIHGHTRAGHFARAVALFAAMRADPAAPPPNEFTFSAALAACAGAANLRAGECVHGALVKSGVAADGVLASSLVSMYAQCGDARGGLRAFELARGAGAESWNAAISCCARHGLGGRAVAELERMVAAGVAPDGMTMAAVLAACAREGMVEEGGRRLGAMAGEYGIAVAAEHCGCVVDLLGRAGYVEEAMTVAMAAERVDDVAVAALAWAAGEWGKGLEEVRAAAGRVGMGGHPAVVMALKKAHGWGGDWAAVAGLRRRCRGLQKAASRVSS